MTSQRKMCKRRLNKCQFKSSFKQFHNFLNQYELKFRSKCARENSLMCRKKDTYSQLHLISNQGPWTRNYRLKLNSACGLSQNLRTCLVNKQCAAYICKMCNNKFIFVKCVINWLFHWPKFQKFYKASCHLCLNSKNVNREKFVFFFFGS